MCLLCGDSAATGLGPFLRSIHCHQLCVKFSHGLRTKSRSSLPKDVEIVREVKRARKLVCVYCKRRGASVNCQAEDCTRTYHLGCGRGRGVLHRHSDSASFCPAHIPFPPLTAPVPRPPCSICSAPVGTDLLQCPACSTYMDRACLDSRASAGASDCPSCADSSAFTEFAEKFGIWFRNPAAEKSLIASGAGAPSPTISYLMRECSSHQADKGPRLVKNMLSPMNQHLAAQKSSRPFQTRPVMRPEEPIVRLTATSSPEKGSTSAKRESDSDVMCVPAGGGWLSTPGNTLPRKQSVDPRRTKSLPGKVLKANKSPNQLISTFFKPISKSSVASESEVEIMEPVEGTSIDGSKDSLTKTKRACSPVNAPHPSPKKPLSPFKTIRMCTNTTKVVRPVMKIELSTDTGTEGPLSDIDDILSGSIPHLEDHPLAEAVFDPANKYLKEIMKKISESEKEDKQSGADEEKECEAEKKAKEKKITEKKAKPEVERKKVLKKAHERKRTDSDSSGKERQRIQIKKLPLASRQIFHGRNWVPMAEFGKGEEEAECECEWVMDYTRNKLEDFVDLNSGEKTMMNLWNKHVNKYQGRGVIHLDNIVEDFLTERSHTIVELNLYRNFVAHLSTLHQGNLLSNETMLKCINDMQDVMKVLGETKTKVWPVWIDQREQAIEAAAAKEAAATVWQQENSAASPSRMVRSAGRVRLNSNLPGCSSPSHGGRSPSRGTCGSPSRLQPSPSRPTSASNSIGRGRRSSNWNKNVQKHLDFDRPQAPMDHFSQMSNEKTPGKSRIRTPSLQNANSDSGDTSASEAGQEVASFLSNFPGYLEPSKEEEDAPFSVHVLTEQPDDHQDSAAEKEEEEKSIYEEQNVEEVEVAEGQRRSSRVASGLEIKDFLRLQAEEFERTVRKAMEKDPTGDRVPVFYVDDAIIEEVGDNLIAVKPKDERLTALKNVYMKVQEKRKAKSQGSGPLAKRARLESRS